MSHYAVLVILPYEPIEEALAAALHPFNENACEVDIDMTDEVNANWLEPVKAVRMTDGATYSRYNDRFYTGREPDDLFLGHSRKVFELPVGAIEIELPQNELGEYRDIADFAVNYHGYTAAADGRFYRQANPNAQWDWYQLGGRYSGKLRSLSGNAVKGEPGVMGSEADSAGVDIVQRKDLDLDTMRAVRVAERHKWLDEIRTKSGLTAAELDEVLKLTPDIDAAWQALDDKPRGQEYGVWIEATFSEDGQRYNAARAVSWDLPELGPHATAAAWADAAPALSCWSVLKDGQWTEKGKMGWWGVSTGNIDQTEWETRVSDLVQTLPADHWLAIVDCHI